MLSVYLPSAMLLAVGYCTLFVRLEKLDVSMLQTLSSVSMRPLVLFFFYVSVFLYIYAFFFAMSIYTSTYLMYNCRYLALLLSYFFHLFLSLKIVWDLDISEYKGYCACRSE